MATRRSEWLASIKPILDRDEAKKDATALAKELGDILEVKVDASSENLSELTKVFNQQLKTMGKQPIVFSEQTLRGIVSQFTQAIAQGINKGFNDGIVNETGKALQQLQIERDKLLGNQKSLKTKHQKLKTINNFAYNLSDAKNNEAHAFNSDEISQMKTNASKLGQSFDDFILSMKSSVEELQYKMSKLKPGSKGYAEAITSFYEQSFDLFRMSRTLSKHPNLVQDKEILEDYSFDNLKDIFADDIFDNIDNFDIAINKSYQSLDGMISRLKEIDVQLQTIQNQDGIINEAKAQKGLKTLDELTAAYNKLKLKEGTALTGPNLLHLNKALQYEPKEKDGIQTFAQKYRDASLSGNWVEEYHALLRYVKLYESYRNSTNKTHQNKVTKKNNPYTQLYDQLKPMAENARNMLQNLVNLGNDTPLVGMGGAEAEKAAAAGKAAASAAQDEANAKAKTREEADAIANTNQKSASAEEKATINAKEKADVNIKSAKAAQEEALAQERSAKAASEQAKTGSILDNPMFANMFGKATKQAEAKQIANEGSATAAQNELSVTQQTTAELEKQQKLLLYRRVEGQADLNRISGRSIDALYDKTGKPIIQDALEMGFGGFGDGLYATTLDAAKDLIPSSGAFSFLEFDASAYTLFINKTAEQAEALQSFLLSLQKLVGAGTILDPSELTHIADLSNDQLFEEAQKIFKNFSMSKQQFDAWIENAKAESEVIANLFAGGQIPSNRHNFGTRFMQTLGYDGVLNQTGDLDFDGNYQGSVIYDPKDDIKQNARIFKDIQEFSSYIQQKTQAHQQNAAAMNVEANAQEHLNQVEGQNPQTSDAVKQEALSYEDLKQKVEAYIKIRQQMWSLMDQNQPWQQLLPDVSAAAKEITNLFPESGETGTTTASMVGNMLQNQVISEDHINGLAQALGVKIPQAAQQTQEAINGIVDAQENLNAVENQNPDAQDESEVHDANAKAIEKEAEAQKKFNALDRSKLYWAIKHPETHPGELDGMLQGNPNLLSDAITQRDVMQQKMQPVNDMASRLSKMSSIKNIPFGDLYQEAANVGKQLSTMYDEGIRDTEEYVALQYKLINIFEKLASSYGGIKGSGAKDRSQFYQWLGDSVQQRTGYNPMQDGRTVDAIWGQDTHSIAKTSNQMFSLKEMASNILGYKGIGSLAFKADASDLSELNFIIDELSKLQQSSDAAKTSVDGLNKSLAENNLIEQSDDASGITKTNNKTEAIKQQNNALEENIALEQQSNAQDGQAVASTGVTSGGVTTDSGADVAAEATQLENLQNTLASVTSAVTAKTQAFTVEEAEVKRVVESEIGSLNELEQKVLSIKGTLEGLVANLKTGQSDIGAGLSNIVINVNHSQTQQNDSGQKQTWALESTLQTVKGVLDGIQTNTAKIGITNTSSATSGDMRRQGIDINSHYLTDPQGKLVEAYRGIHDSYGGLISNRYHSGTFSTDDIELAKQYAGETGKIEKILLSMRNPLELDGQGAQWHEIEYIGNKSDEASKRLHELRNALHEVSLELATAWDEYSRLPGLDFTKKNWSAEEEQLHALRQDYYDKVHRILPPKKDAILAEIQSIFDDPSNPYMRGDTNEIAEMAKTQGYDGVIFKNIKDGLDKASNVFVTFGEEQMHYIETLSANTENAIKQQTGTVNATNVDTISDTTLDGRLTEIKSVLESIDNKIAKGGVIAKKDDDSTNNTRKDKDTNKQTSRAADIKSLTKDYERLAKLSAQFKENGNLETKAMIDNLKDEIRIKRDSLNLTMDENQALREKYANASKAEARLLAAAKAQQKINDQRKTADKDAKQQAKDVETEWKKRVKDAQRSTGINAATSTANAGDQTVVRAIGTEGVSKDIENKTRELSDQIKALRVLRDEIDKKGEKASDDDRDKLSKQISKVKELKTKLDSYLKIHEKYSGEGVTQFNDVDTSNFGAVGTVQYWNNITAAIKKASDGRVAIKGMNTDTGELEGTTKIAANTFATWSATVDPFSGKLSMLRTGIKKTETIVEQITRKTKEIFTYFSGSSLIFKVFNEIRRGVQYVKEIDLALTELKKVTDETEETYDRFLDTAAKTADKVGSTIQKVVSSTADWARLNI